MFLFGPFLLISNCLSLFFFKQWLGPKGLFITSLGFTIMSFFIFISELKYILVQNHYMYIDLGRIFFSFDLLDSHLIFIVDNLNLILAILVLLLSVFAQFFGIEYMYREAFVVRLLYLLNFFSTSVVFLFFVFDFFLILITWELIGLFSLLLVNFYASRIYTIKAALKTFIFSRFSDLFIFIMFLLCLLIFNTTDLSILFLQIPFFLFYNIYIGMFGINLLTILSFCIVIASAVKAAQFMFHVWLPDAMEAPTPASALIHSSTLVIMGIYLIIRFNLLFEFSYLTNLILILWGSCTITFGAIVASYQNDIKKLVAYSTISQMGYLFCGCGFFCYTEVLFYLITHALNKAFLFMLVGYIVHFFNGNTDLRYMGSLYIYGIDFVFIVIIISLNLTGLPYTAGFLSKEFLLFQTFKMDLLVLFVRMLWFGSLFFTPIYMLWLNINVFFYLKLAPTKLYKQYQFFIGIRYLELQYIMTRFTLINSSISIFIFLFFFILIIVFGEYFLFIILDINTSSTTINSANWVTLVWFDWNLILFQSSTLIYLLTYLIISLFIFSCRYLFILKYVLLY